MATPNKQQRPNPMDKINRTLGNPLPYKRAGGQSIHRAGSGEISGSSENNLAAQQTNLIPGEMPLTGTGGAQASGGASSDGTAEYHIERPMSIFDDRISTYKKVHKFMTFGLAPNLIQPNTTGPNVNDIWLTTWLAEVPWHLPTFYLTKSEFDILDIGARCIEVNIEVYYRGSTIQFETASTSTGLATLNQINDIGVAHGLNRTGWGSDVTFNSFGMPATSQSMIPRSIRRPKYIQETGYLGMQEDYYGVNNQGGPSFTGYTPNHQLGRQCFLYNYFAMSTRLAQITTPPTNSNLWGGWPCLAEKIEQMDGKTVVNTCISSSTYKPKFGQLKTPLKHLGLGLPYPNAGGSQPIILNGHLTGARTLNATRDTFDPTNTVDGDQGDRWSNLTEGVINYGNDDNSPTPLQPQWSYYSPIEKSQLSRSGFWGEVKPHIQPSCHIGIQPIPSLSTVDFIAMPTPNDGKWTDCRGYWEVVATMKVKEYTPTHLPYAGIPNVPQGDVLMELETTQCPPFNIDPRNQGATFAALHTNAIPALPLV